MNILSKVIFWKNCILQNSKLLKLYSSPSLEKEQIIGEILRNTHSIEKGLSLSKVRLGFGVQKCQEAAKLVDRFIEIGGNPNDEAILMFTSALESYLRFHESKQYRDHNIEVIESLYKKLSSYPTVSFDNHGGTLDITKPIYSTDEIRTFEKLFNDRHSIREFTGTPVDEVCLKKAIQLAMRCPSACNRQCYRVHIVNKSAFSRLDGWLGGVGGFDQELDKILIITGETSMYRWTENMQWVVTSSIFAGYLSLALQVYGIGACVIQRDVFPNNKWNEIRENLQIRKDELPVCCIGIGNLKDEYKVPISNRLSYDKITTQID